MTVHSRRRGTGLSVSRLVPPWGGGQTPPAVALLSVGAGGGGGGTSRKPSPALRESGWPVPHRGVPGWILDRQPRPREMNEKRSDRRVGLSRVGRPRKWPGGQFGFLLRPPPLSRAVCSAMT